MILLAGTLRTLRMITKCDLLNIYFGVYTGWFLGLVIKTGNGMASLVILILTDIEHKNLTLLK